MLEVTPHHHWHQTRNEKESLKRNYFHNILFPPCSRNSQPFTLRCESTSVLRAFTWKSFPREMSFHLIPMVIAKCHHYTSYLSFFMQPQYEAKNATHESAEICDKSFLATKLCGCKAVFSRSYWIILRSINFFTQPAVVRVVTNKRCGHHSLPLNAQKHRENCKFQWEMTRESNFSKESKAKAV